ncbi:MAG: hypothetical protein IT454_22010 [Planctomycetes bacterium]|nr:hypothetical protein [Planctomycetota bacterium]
MSKPLMCAVLTCLASCDEPTPSPRSAGQTSAPAGSNAEAPSARPGSVPALLPAQLPRLTTERFVAAVAAYERGELARAEELRLTLPSGLDVELLGARIAAARGDEIAAVRAIEEARERAPDQGRVYATAAEIHAAAGRLASAEDEIREGLERAGPTPDLTRARGVLALCREGGARKGLEHLLAARDKEPTLEYCLVPLAQAHVLLGNAALAGKQPVEAVGHARAALLAWPDDVDATQLLADARAAVGEFGEALELYEKLLARGVDLRGALATLYARAATAALLEKDGRALAVQRYLRARELGLSAEELGFGVSVLHAEAERHIESGLASYDSGALDGARTAFESALRAEPESLEALNHLGVVDFRQARFADAAARWRQVLELAERGGIELPEPVHLNLARALHQAGRRPEVRAVLEHYLARQPEGEFAAETRAMLARLDSESRDG